jgi:hypothetical protein
MYRYQPSKIVELDQAVSACIKARQRMERASLRLLGDAQARIMRAQRLVAAVASAASTPDGQDASKVVRQ